jgi:hypothetical protein
MTASREIAAVPVASSTEERKVAPGWLYALRVNLEISERCHGSSALERARALSASAVFPALSHAAAATSKASTA